MKKSRFISAIMALLLAVSMCVGSSATAFAAEETTPEAPVDITESVGQVLYADGKDFSGSTTISLTMTSGNWSADFLGYVIDSTGALYEIVLTTPSGTTYTAYVNGSSGSFVNIKNFIYASAGTYTFKFTNVYHTGSSAHALAEICD